ncbi:MAG: glycoside hydrolase family 57 protein [Desulfovibrio sp.]
MIGVCFYFQVHQPRRINQDFSFFDIGSSTGYFDDRSNREILLKVAEKCYLPANYMMLDLINKLKGKFRISYAVTGTAIEQFQMYAPEVMRSFQELAQTGCVEFISETYSHSLSYLFSREEFVAQVEKHKKLMQESFGQTPVTFRNTELIYNNSLAKTVEDMGYKVILTEGADQVLGWRTPNYVYVPSGCYKLRALLKNYRLSDDIAFRFSDPNWDHHPLHVDTYSSWLHSIAGQGEVVNLFMDYETIGEHQWADSGIFEFFRRLPETALSHPDFCFTTPSEAADLFSPMARLDVPYTISWADVERDTTAWIGNSMQDASIERIYALEKDIKEFGTQTMIDEWRDLLTSDHFYYMCTKWFSDGDVHKYFNPFKTPHQAFITYMNIVNDLTLKVEEVKENIKCKEQAA